MSIFPLLKLWGIYCHPELQNQPMWPVIWRWAAPHWLHSLPPKQWHYAFAFILPSESHLHPLRNWYCTADLWLLVGYISVYMNVCETGHPRDVYFTQFLSGETSGRLWSWNQIPILWESKVSWALNLESWTSSQDLCPLLNLIFLMANVAWMAAFKCCRDWTSRCGNEASPPSLWLSFPTN